MAYSISDYIFIVIFFFIQIIINSSIFELIFKNNLKLNS